METNIVNVTKPELLISDIIENKPFSDLNKLVIEKAKSINRGTIDNFTLSYFGITENFESEKLKIKDSQKECQKMVDAKLDTSKWFVNLKTPNDDIHIKLDKFIQIEFKEENNCLIFEDIVINGLFIKITIYQSTIDLVSISKIKTKKNLIKKSSNSDL